MMSKTAAVSYHKMLHASMMPPNYMLYAPIMPEIAATAYNA